MAEQSAGPNRTPPRIGLEIRQAHFPDRAPIDAYGNGGFRFADMSHKGSILALPSGIYGWAVADPSSIDAASLDQVIKDSAALGLLLVGTGAALEPLAEAVRTTLADHGIRLEVMATGPAVRTYNVLLSEDRQVGAALIAVD